MKTYILTIIFLFSAMCFVVAQDSVYVYKAGIVTSKCAVNNLDSMSFKYTPLTRGKVTDIDGNTYNTLKFGTQTWMLENLKTTKFRSGESISNISSGTEWGLNSSYAAWCDYNNNAANGSKYGKLYNWYAVNDSRNIAPLGWHVASDAEWTILENYLIDKGYNFDGSKSGNKIAKSLASTTEWTSNLGEGVVGNNLSLNNLSGFSALPSGRRDVFNNCNFDGNFEVTYWWTSTGFDVYGAWARYLNYNSNSLNRYNYGYRQFGFAVRCIKD